MKPVPPHGSAAPERAVDCAGDADGEAPHPAAQSARIIGFDDEMEMVVLDAYSTLRTAPRCASSATLGIP